MPSDWDEAIRKLESKIPALLTEGDLTINDARVIQHLIGSHAAADKLRDNARRAARLAERQRWHDRAAEVDATYACYSHVQSDANDATFTIGTRHSFADLMDRESPA